MTLVIGLTGSIGTGKSTISKRLVEIDIPVIDADIIARDVVEPGEPAYKKVVEAFGSTILLNDQSLNRKALGKIVFGNNEKRKVLNNIIHPEIRKRMIKQRDSYVDENVPCIVLDIPLLFESNLTHLVDKILVISVDEKTQLERIIKRDGSTVEDTLQRIASQIPVKEKAEKADAVINNNHTKNKSYQQLDKILNEWNIK